MHTCCQAWATTDLHEGTATIRSRDKDLADTIVAREDALASARSLTAQLDELKLCYVGKPHRLATLTEAMRVQTLVEKMLAS